ncbi:DUF2147 domain-containing protein [Phenylobacterium sp.]|uniref:DUF2147 domain-containing protein n=1 Tax=Phenylobacterium sp. TaxID=1871053 RepID=UPI002FE33239
MRHLLAAAALACAVSPALAADPVEGEWLTPGGAAKVHIAPCQGRPDRLCGAIVWLRDALDKAGRPVRDTANPDPALRGRALVGLPFIRDFRRVETARWTGGKIYDPQTGKTYDSRLRLNPDGTLKLEGCVLVVCQGQTWRRP